MAGLAHLSVFFLSVIVPLVIFLLQRDSGRSYVVYQSLQALVWQLASFVLALVFGCCLMIGFAGFWPALVVPNPGSSELAAGASIIGGLLVVLVSCIFGVVVVAYAVVALVGAIRCFQGRPFTYPLVGRWAQRFVPVDGTP